ncbi:sulfotransferase 1C2 [Nematostella vectensis]|nr:sulfotransferase 1C2 [Nematostella vectensis]
MALSTPQDSRVEPYQLPAEFREIDKIRYLPGVTRELLDEIKNLPVQEGDVFVATYPKCGTTWVSEIVWQIFNDGQIDKSDIIIRVPFLEAYPMIQKRGVFVNDNLTEFYRSVPAPRVFKTHLHHHFAPMGIDTTPKPKYIYVMRNPKDCAVSLFFHCKGMAYYKCDASWLEFFEAFIRGRVEEGLWFDHVLGWWKHHEDPNILFLKYEDMKKDLPRTVRQIASFVGRSPSEEVIARIVRQTTFDAMKDGEQFYQRKRPDFKPGFKFIRKGEVGDWRNYFTDEQNRRVDEMYTRMMTSSGLQLEFEPDALQ